jgi:hypothetical protein
MTQFGGLVQLAFNDNGGSQPLTSRITYTAPTNGTYVVAVRDAANRGNFGYRYAIDFSVTGNVAPTVTAPTPFLTPGQTLGNPAAGQYTVNIQARWTASDPDDGIASQALQMQVNNAGYTALAPTLDGAIRARNVTMTIGTTNQLQISATDFAADSSGFVSGPSFQIRGAQQTDSAFTYAGAWANLNAASAWDGTMKVLNNGAAGNKAVFAFYGGRAALVGSQRPDGGKAEIYIDGVYKTTVDFYSASVKNRRVLYAVNDLPSIAPDGGAHVMEVRWVNSHNAASTGYRLYIDGGISLYNPGISL